jgi:hypothetical protein
LAENFEKCKEKFIQECHELHAVLNNTCLDTKDFRLEILQKSGSTLLRSAQIDSPGT